MSPWLRASPPSLGQFAWTYHVGTSLKASLAYPNGLVASWAYDAENRLAQVRNAMPSGVISQFDYTYDAAGRRVAIARSGTAFGDLSGAADRYAYNARGEVTGARRTKDGADVRGFSEDFAYDPIGNRTSSATYDETGEAQVSTYVANALNQYVSRTTPGFAAVRGEADPDAAVTVNGRPAYRLGAYFFGGDVFDNSASGGFARLETYAALAQADADGNDADDLVSSVTGQVYVAQSPEAFAYDADGNQTRVTTRTGRWRVEYNGENRPILWTREGDGKTVAMSFDHMGRRRTKGAQRFFYDGYLQVANERTVSNAVVRQFFVWDPTEPVATRPLAWFDSNAPPRFYTHDGNKNVSEAVAADAATNEAVEVVAHYDYAAFGAVIAQKGACAEANPWRFSSEYEDTDLGLDYYNYRHYEPVTGRWLARDLAKMAEDDLCGLYVFVANDSISYVDLLGEKRNPGNRRPGIPPMRPRIPPVDIVPPGPSIPSDGSLADALASLYSMVYGSRMAAEKAGEEACKRLSPSMPPNSCPKGRPSLGAGMGRCCRVSILKQRVGEYEIYSLEKVSVDNMSCDEAREQSGLWADYPGVERILHDRPWR